MEPATHGASRFVTVNTAASILGICRRTLERLVERRQFPHPVKIGRKSVYTMADVDAYIAKVSAERDRFA